MPPRPAPPRELVAFLEASPQPQIVIDGQYHIVAANAAYLHRYSPDAPVAGRRCHEVSHGIDVPCDQAGESCPLARARASGRRERVVHLHHTPHGESYVDVELTPVTPPPPRGAAPATAFFVERMEPLPLAHGHAGPRGLVGRAPAFRAMLELVARVGPSEASVLLLGESGTGKELVARAVHDASARAEKPLVVVDCASMAETLFESELFGHERGAFTGATAAKPGLVEAADGGTLFLDEVGDIPLAIQVKLLRLLETGTYRRVGGTDVRHADLRVVSATHRDLGALMAQGQFREDLFFRLSTFPLRVPPLRERMDDLPLLARTLLERLRGGRRRLALAPGALQQLARHDYPGNVRELRNVIERAALLADGPAIDAAAIARALEPLPGLSPARAVAVPPPAVPRRDAPRRLDEVEDAVLRERLAAHDGNRRELARSLGISERTLYRKLRRLA